MKKNLTSFHFGAKVTSRHPPQPEMVAFARATYKIVPATQSLELIEDPIEQGFMRGDKFADDDVDRVRELLYADDFADFKPKAEVLLRGTCHAPNATPVIQSLVRVQVGEWSKTIAVWGDRFWKPGLFGHSISEPIPFLQMPLDYTRAFGGLGYAENPVGLGVGTPELPNLESPTKPIRSPNDRPPMACFGPINPAWPPRAGKIGRKYGKKWKAERAPWVSEDFDWTYHNAAPDDQQLPDYFVGDERVLLQNLHPHFSAIEFQLPALRVRVFVKTQAGEFREVPMNLDTVFFDTDQMRVLLTWRGHTDCDEDDMTDIKSALLAAEPQSEPPTAPDEYKIILDDFEDDPVGLKDHVPDGFLEQAEKMKALEDAELAAQGVIPSADQTVEQAAAAVASGDAGGMDPMSTYVKSKLGPLAPAEQLIGQEHIALANSVWEATKLNQMGPESMFSLIEKSIANMPPPVSLSPAPMVPGSPPHVSMSRVLNEMAAARQRFIDSGFPPDSIRKLDEALFSNPQLAQIDQTFTPAPPMEVPPDAPEFPEPKVPGQAAETAAAPDADTGGAAAVAGTGGALDYSGKDLTGHDFSHQDLTGATFEGSVLMEANFEHATLDGANFRFAVMQKANLHHASFVEADLSMADLDRVNATNANFTGAQFDRTSACKANFSEAILENIAAPQARFERTNLCDAKAEGGNFDMAQFDGAWLERADFRRASFLKASMRGTMAPRANFNEATITNWVGSMKADFTGATFVDATAPQSIWQESTLTGADFSYANLREAHFEDARADGANFYAAVLSASGFRKASLPRAIFNQANLFDAEMTKTDLSFAKFIEANLYSTKLLDAVLVGCDFTRANLDFVITGDA